MNVINHNNQWIPENTAIATVFCRSQRFGDGIFDTLLVIGGKVFHPETPWQRISDGLRFYQLHLPDTNLRDICQEIIQRNKLNNGYIRVIISRDDDVGNTGLGFLPTNLSAPANVTVQTINNVFPSVIKYLKLWQSDVILANYAPCKTISSMPYISALLQAKNNNTDNAILCDPFGNICETASGNLFWVKDDVLYTPALDLPFINGTIRQIVIKLWSGNVMQGHYKLSHIIKADYVFMTNIGGIIFPITEIQPIGAVFSIPESLIVFRQNIINYLINNNYE